MIRWPSKNNIRKCLFIRVELGHFADRNSIRLPFRKISFSLLYVKVISRIFCLKQNLFLILRKFLPSNFNVEIFEGTFLSNSNFHRILKYEYTVKSLWKTDWRILQFNPLIKQTYSRNVFWTFRLRPFVLVF